MIRTLRLSGPARLLRWAFAVDPGFAPGMLSRGAVNNVERYRLQNLGCRNLNWSSDHLYSYRLIPLR